MTVFSKPAENGNLMSNISQEQAYEISPYKGSDDEDEDEEDDETENNKFIPSWARYATQFCYLDRNPFNEIRLLIHIEHYMLAHAAVLFLAYQSFCSGNHCNR
jgi:hypothetical protein